MPTPGRARTATITGPLLALAVVCALDAVHSARDWPVPVVGVLDEPAHLLTAWLALAALGRGGRWTSVPGAPWVLLGSVAVDLDHIPLFLWSEPVAQQGSRPVIHSALTVAVLLLVAAVAAERVRVAVLGLAAGVALHLVRDVAWDPGIPLLWPLSPVDVQLPYGAYLGALVLTTGIAVARVLRRTGGQRRSSPLSRRR